jgi:predicted cupin superfamily sugar epimerase
VEEYALLPHPEGGYHKESYRSLEKILANALPAYFSEEKCLSTAICFLLQKGDFSPFSESKVMSAGIFMQVLAY